VSTTNNRGNWVLLFAALASCRTKSDNSPEEAAARSPVLGSSSLQEALAGKIEPLSPAGGRISADITGEASVGHDGSANYRIPLWVPEGVNGLKPSLAVEYNSESTIGLLGPRWHLDGLSAITRCAKTRAQDGAQAPVDFFGDTFCLDGQRLIRLSPTGLEFRTERDMFAKVVATLDENGDFATFTVYQRDGRILTYGSTLSSRLHGTPVDAPRDAAYAYYVDRVEDRWGMAMTITYTDVVATPTTAAVVQEPIPLEITWGLSGKRHVTFDYNPLPNGAAINPDRRYVNGLGIGRNRTLSVLHLWAPDGTDLAPEMKRYSFSYGQPRTTDGSSMITRDNVLLSIDECDGNGVCKRPTQISWELGSLQYSLLASQAGDVPFRSQTYTGNTYYLSDAPLTNYSTFYERLIAADVNGDGRDDLVYRGYISPHHNGYFDCLGWRSRYSIFAPGDTSGTPIFGTSNEIVELGSDPDTSCRANLVSASEYQKAKGGTAWDGDIILSDLNGDGYADIVSPIGKSTGFDSNGNRSPVIVGFRAYLNAGNNSPGSFGSPINFLDSIGQLPGIANFSNPRSTPLAIGDVDGDGLPEVIRHTDGSLQHLAAATISGAGLTSGIDRLGGSTFPYAECTIAPTCNKPISELGIFASIDPAAVDMDGDGTTELIRSNIVCLPGKSCPSVVTSPTLNKSMPLPAAVDVNGAQRRWFMDVNGDGLDDLVTGNSAGVTVAFATGRGFDLANKVTTAGPSTSTGSNQTLMWAADVNADGRQDLILASTSVDQDSATTTMVMFSDGTGRFYALPIPVPAVSWSDGLLGQPITRVVADFNGDGLPDIAQVTPRGVRTPTTPTFQAFIHRGKAPEFVTSIAEGLGRTITFTYDVSSLKDGAFYSASTASTCDTDRKRLECLNRGRWLTRSLSISSLDAPTTTQTFAYRGGVSDKNGRGFLGFTQRDVYGPGSRHTRISYDPLSRVFLATGYVYDRAMLPKETRVDVDTPQGTNRHHYELTSTTYATQLLNGSRTYSVDPADVTHSHSDCPTTSGATCNGTERLLSSQRHTLTFDAYGNRTYLRTNYMDGAGTVLRSDVQAVTYLPPDTTNWLVNLPDAARPATLSSTSFNGSRIDSSLRTVAYTADTIHGGVQQIEIEPSGDDATYLKRRLLRDSVGRLNVIVEADRVTGTYRETILNYDAEDPFPFAITDPTGLRTKLWRHPGLSLLVEMDDPNNLAATWTYDSFGRLRSTTGSTGATQTMSYDDSLAVGSTVTVNPEGKQTRQIQIHYDAFGRELSRSYPIDATKSEGDYYTYDAMGRVATETLKSLPQQTVLNTFTLAYDDMDRLLTDYHLGSDGNTYHTTNAYDGLTVTVTDEYGRVVTHISDAMGRPLIQRADLTTGTSDATFMYGPFDELLRMTLSDGSGQTDIGYDGRGREISLTRAGVGARITKYNGYGDVIGTSKQAADGTVGDVLVFGRDADGRLTSISGTGISRTFTWGSAIPAKGKLVSADESGASSVRFEYGPNGLLSRKTYNGQTTAAPFDLGWEGYEYDSQGRLSTLTYPAAQTSASSGWSHPLRLYYAYDDYNGEPSAITEEQHPSDPIWSVTARSERGQPTTEVLRHVFGASPTSSTRMTSYFAPTGLPNTLALSGTSGQSQLAYWYDPSGLPQQLGATGTGTGAANAGWKSFFGYDNLLRLTTWQTGPVTQGGKTVTYKYDGAGNMTERSWNSEIVTYAEQSGSRTATVTQGGGGTLVRTDTFKVDLWGRIFDTPSASMGYDALDELTSMTEKATGQVDTVRHNALGERMVTVNSNGDPYSVLYTLGDLYEFSTTATGSTERCRVRVGNKLIGELVRTGDVADRSSTFYLTDNVGSVVAEVSASGAVTSRVRRDPYGNTSPSIQSPTLPGELPGNQQDGTGRMGLADHPRDPNWGLVDMNARLYSPLLGRFATPDPILANPFDRREHNPFAYALNIPTALVDHSGLCSDRPEDTDPCPQQPTTVPPSGSGGGGSGSMRRQGPCDGKPDCMTAVNNPPKPHKTALQAIPAAKAVPTSANASTSANRNMRTGGATGAGRMINQGPRTLDLTGFTSLRADQYPTDASDAYLIVGTILLPTGLEEVTEILVGRAVSAALGKGAGRAATMAARAAGDVAEREVTKSGILFGQDSVSYVFSHGRFKGMTIGDVVAGLRAGTISADELKLDVVVRKGQTITLNNRSLVALTRAGVKPTRVIDHTGDKMFEKALDDHLRGGLPSDVIRIRGGASNASWLE
jgi:RHS repeat-associated protein